MSDLDLDALLAQLGGVRDTGADEPGADEPGAAADEPVDLDALLAELGGGAPPAEDVPAASSTDDLDLDALLAELGGGGDAAVADEPRAPVEAPDQGGWPRTATAESSVAPRSSGAPVPAPPPRAAAAAPARPAPPPPWVAPPLDPPPEDLIPEEASAWAELNTLIEASRSASEVDRGTLWYTVVGRQGPPVVLVGAHDNEAGRRLARPEGDAGRRVASQAGAAMFVRNTATREAKLVLTSGLGAPDARKKVVAELERLGYFRGFTVRF